MDLDFFYNKKNAPKRLNACVFPAIEMYGVCRLIENHILQHFDLLKFKIGILENEKIVLSKFDLVSPFKK